MGYESLEGRSLVTLKFVLDSYIKKELKKGSSQNVKDVAYELSRINEMLEYR